MAKSQISYGSQGSDVKELQKKLNQNGYKLSVDGIFGSNTQKAVKDYQKKNGLTVDGIVGNDTWSAISGTVNNIGTAVGLVTNKTKEKTDDEFKYEDFSYDDFTYDDYQESETVKQAQAALNVHLANKPGEYSSQWSGQLDEVIKKILNREEFSYDLNGDALYQQYKDKYIQQGKMAMGDAIGQASAMTGGYGNSYAQSVGQQQYQAQLENLNDIVPELYAMAYDKYNQEGQALYNQYAMLGERESTDYSRYQDELSRYLTERDYLTGRYDTERELDYSKYADDRNFEYSKYSDDKNLAYQDYRNKIADEQWRESFDYTKERDKIADEQWQKQFDYTASENATDRKESNAKDYYESKGKVGYDNGSVSPENIKKMQEALGITADGKWGSGSTEAAGGLTADQAWKAYQGGKLGQAEATVQPTENENTTAFINRFQTKDEYLARGHSEKEFNAYMESNIVSFLRNGRITESEALYLIEYYGLS